MPAIIRFLGIRGLIALFLAVVLSGVTLWSHHVTSQRNELRDWQNAVVASTRLAADQPRLAVDQVPLQISYLGAGLVTLRASIATLNRDAKDRADQFEHDKATAAAELAAMDHAAEVSDQRIAQLRRLASAHSGCTASPELLEALKGL